MKNIVFIIFAIHILQGSENEKLPALGWYQSLKETSHKNIILTSLVSSTLGVLSHKFFPKDKLWAKKALTGLAILGPIGISAFRSIYFGKANDKIFNRNNPLHSTKYNIFLERLYLLALTQPEAAYKIFEDRDGQVLKSQFKNDHIDPLYNIFLKTQKEESEKKEKKDKETKIEIFKTKVNELTAENATEKLPALFDYFKEKAPNEDFAQILVASIKNIYPDPKDAEKSIENYEKTKKNIYLKCFFTFVLFEYTKEEAIQEIKKIISDNA